MATRSRRHTVSREHEGRAEPRQGPGDVVVAVLEGSPDEQEAKSHGCRGRDFIQVMKSLEAGLRHGAEGAGHRSAYTICNPRRVESKARHS